MRVLRVRYNDKVFYAALHQSADGQGGQKLEVQCLNKELGFNDLIPLQQVQVLPPVMPTKVVCVGLNYKKHAEEMGKPLPDEPMIFLKPPTAIIGSGQPIILPRDVGRVDYEGELVIVMGKTARHISAADAPQHIFGFACGNDVTARVLQKKDIQYSRAKGFDTFAPVGPWIETEVENPSALLLRTLINGAVRQESSTSDMIFEPFSIVSFVSRVMTLHPGDVIFTGTPSGIGQLSAEDEVRVDISSVGTLINTVMDEVLIPDASRTEEVDPLQ